MGFVKGVGSFLGNNLGSIATGAEILNDNLPSSPEAKPGTKEAKVDTNKIIASNPQAGRIKDKLTGLIPSFLKPKKSLIELLKACKVAIDAYKADPKSVDKKRVLRDTMQKTVTSIMRYNDAVKSETAHVKNEAEITAAEAQRKHDCEFAVTLEKLGTQPGNSEVAHVSDKVSATEGPKPSATVPKASTPLVEAVDGPKPSAAAPNAPTSLENPPRRLEDAVAPPVLPATDVGKTPEDKITIENFLRRPRLPQTSGLDALQRFKAKGENIVQKLRGPSRLVDPGKPFDVTQVVEGGKRKNKKTPNAASVATAPSPRRARKPRRPS
jgi:hypothetical protein